MERTLRIAKIIAAVLIVVTIGALIGWFYVVQSNIESIEVKDVARGSSLAPSFGGTSGSAFQNALGGDFAIEPSASSSSAPAKKAAPRLWRIASNPVSGFGFATTTPRVLFVDTATGNILEADPLTSDIVRRSNTIFPKSFDAKFSSEGSVVLRFFENNAVRTYAARLPTSTPQQVSATSTARLSGTYLPTGIVDIAILPKEILVYALPDAAGGIQITQSDIKGGSQKKLITLPLRDWRLHAAQDGTVVLAQKASDGIPGYSFTLSPSGILAPLIENRAGLTVLAKNPRAVIFGTSDGGLALSARQSRDAEPTNLSLATIAEKCVWSRGTTLVAWCAVPRASAGSTDPLLDLYQGVRHTSDVWYRLDVAAGTAVEIFTPDGSANIDVENPSIDAGNRYIAFTNAADKSLWVLRIEP